MLGYSCGQLTRRDELAASTDATVATQGSNVASTFGRRELLFIDALRHLGVHALAGEHPRTNVKERLPRLRHGASDHRAVCFHERGTSIGIVRASALRSITVKL